MERDRKKFETNLKIEVQIQDKGVWKIRKDKMKVKLMVKFLGPT